MMLVVCLAADGPQSSTGIQPFIWNISNWFNRINPHYLFCCISDDIDDTTDFGFIQDTKKDSILTGIPKRKQA